MISCLNLVILLGSCYIVSRFSCSCNDYLFQSEQRNETHENDTKRIVICTMERKKNVSRYDKQY